ncbi:MAG: rhodanese-like domain-containing protein [Bacteroidota bacterium]
MAKTLADFVREARTRIREISVEEFDEMIENHDDLLIVDVREADEYHHGHLPGALLVPRGLLEGAADAACKWRVEKLREARSRTLVLYCQNGSRSALAADTLQQMGFENVYNLAGGVEMWQAEGFALVSE